MAEVGLVNNVARLFNCTGDRELCHRLVLGSTTKCRALFIDFYIELTGQKAASDDGLVPWSIDNKYYSAVVNLRVHHVTSDAVDECDGEAVVFLCSVRL